METPKDEAERLLLDRRPAPRPEFVRALEASLLARSRRRDRFRVLAAAGALSASLAAVTLVLSVAGLLPSGDRAGRSAEAGTECKTIFVVRHERRPVLVVGSDGEIRTERQVVEVRRPVKRCP